MSGQGMSDRPRLALLVMVAAVAWLVAGVSMPLWGFRDSEGASDEHLRRLKGEAAQRAQVPRVKLQAVEAEELSDDPYAVAGIVIWRGPFGIELGRAGIGEVYTDEPYAAVAWWWVMATWLGFLVMPVALAVFALRLAM